MHARAVLTKMLWTRCRRMQKGVMVALGTNKGAYGWRTVRLHLCRLQYTGTRAALQTRESRIGSVADSSACSCYTMARKPYQSGESPALPSTGLVFHRAARTTSFG